MTPLMLLAFRAMGLTQEDVAQGWKDVAVQTVTGSKHVVRVTALAPSLREGLIHRYTATDDARVLVRPMVEPQYATDNFLDSLAPGSLAHLANVAIGLFVGQDMLQKMIESQESILTEKGSQ